MAVKKTLNTLKERTNWFVARKALKNLDFKVSQGWGATLQALSTDNHGEKIPSLLRLLRELNLCSEKQVTMFDLAENISALREKIKTLSVEENQLSEAYPFSVSFNSLEDSKKFFKPKLIAIEKLDGGIGLVFSSYRVINERKEINPASLGDDFSEYSEMYAIKRKYTQAFDILWIPDDGTVIEMRLDTLLAPNVQQLLGAKAGIINLVKNEFGIVLNSVVNIFDKINQLYLNKAEGTVLELGFDTTTASTKLEKMKKIKGAPCLRDEAYHMGGKKGLDTEIAPFHIHLRWERVKNQDCESSPELLISVNSFQLLKNPQVANDYIVKKCMDLNDYKFIQSKLK